MCLLWCCAAVGDALHSTRATQLGRVRLLPPRREGSSAMPPEACIHATGVPQPQASKWLSTPMVSSLRSGQATCCDVCARCFLYFCVQACCVPHHTVMRPCLQDGRCPQGDSCHFAHSLFEYWLHPARCVGHCAWNSVVLVQHHWLAVAGCFRAKCIGSCARKIVLC